MRYKTEVKQIAEAMRELMKKDGRHISTLASDAGLPADAVRRCFMGTHQQTFVVVWRLCAALGASLADLEKLLPPLGGNVEPEARESADGLLSMLKKQQPGSKFSVDVYATSDRGTIIRVRGTRHHGHSGVPSTWGGFPVEYRRLLNTRRSDTLKTRKRKEKT